MNNDQLHNEHPDIMANIDGDANSTAGESEYNIEDILGVESPHSSSGGESDAPNWDSSDDTEEEGQGGNVGGAGDEAAHIEVEEYEGGEGGNDEDVGNEGDDEDDDDEDYYDAEDYHNAEGVDDDEDDDGASEGERPLFIRSGAPSPELPPWASA